MNSTGRQLAKFIGGPEDGNYFSVGEDTEAVTGINLMAENESYVRDGSSLQEIPESEWEHWDDETQFRGHELRQVVNFHYVKAEPLS